MKKIIIGLMAVLAITACTPLTDLNSNPKAPEVVEPGTLFANATVELFDFMSSTNVNVNNFRLWAQQWAQTTYADESNFELNERNVSGRAFNRLYATVIRDIREAKAFLDANTVMPADEKAAQAAIYEVEEIFAWHILVDIFGHLPYTESFSESVVPLYDTDEAIYADLATRLDAAIATLSSSSSSGLGDADLIYGGDPASWAKSGNSLKLRMAIRMSDVDAAKAKSMAEAAAAGVFESSSDDYELAYQASPPNTNPLWEDLIQSGRSDFIAANTMTDILNNLEDPRIDNFYQDEVTIDTTTGAMGIMGGEYGNTNNYSSFSHPGTMQVDPTHPGTLLSYTEVRFLLAEAARLGFNVGGTAEEHYNAAIRSSILEWAGSPAEVDAYLSQEKVAFSTAAGTDEEKIALQKWIALYDQGFEAWSSWRLHDYPLLNVAVQSGQSTPTRYTYPVTEYNLNPDNLASASTEMGGDTKYTKVFWDAN